VLYGQRAKKYAKEGNLVDAMVDLNLFFQKNSKGQRPVDLLVLGGVIEDALFNYDSAVQFFSEAIEVLFQTKAFHDFELYDAHKPRTCLACGGKIAAAKYLGCNNCLTVIHPACDTIFPHGCYSSAEKQHVYVSRKIHVPTHCATCNSSVTRLSGEVSYCIHCGDVVHAKCLDTHKQQADCKAAAKPGLKVSDIYNCRGLAFYHNSKYEEAFKDFTVAIELILAENNPKLANSYYANRGLTQYYRTNYHDAVLDFTVAISGGFVHPQVFAMRASSYQILGMELEANKDWQMAHELDTQIVTQVFPYPMPIDVIGVILSLLAPRDLQACAVTCRKWRSIARGMYD